MMTLAYVIVAVMLVLGLALAGGIAAGVWLGVSSLRPDLLRRRSRD